MAHSTDVLRVSMRRREIEATLAVLKRIGVALAPDEQASIQRLEEALSGNQMDPDHHPRIR